MHEKLLCSCHLQSNETKLTLLCFAKITIIWPTFDFMNLQSILDYTFVAIPVHNNYVLDGRNTKYLSVNLRKYEIL